MPKKIKILFIHHATGWGGAPINMINIINELDKSIYEPHVLLLKDSIVKEKLAESKIPYTICKLEFYKNRYTYFSHTDAGYIKPYRIFKLIKLIISWNLSRRIYAKKVLRKLDFDIVHLNSSVLSDWIKPASRFGKVIYHIQEPISKGTFGIRYNFIRSEVKKYADKVIAISKDNAKRINLPDKTEVVYNFIDIPENIYDNSDSKSILYVGGAAKIKGIDVLIEAIPLINKDITINLAGHFPNLRPLGKIKKLAYRILYPSAYKSRTKLAEIAECKSVNIIGSFSNIKDVLTKNTLLISPFTVPHFSRPVIEAFAYGKPVIASDVKGMDEIVNHNTNGIIFKNGDANGLADAINSLINNYELVKTMGANGRKKAFEFFEPISNTKKIEHIYLELMEDQP